MKSKLIYVLTIIITIILTSFVCCNICSEKSQSNSPQLNEKNCIELLESGTQMALNYVSAYKNQKTNYTLASYIETIEKAFAEDVEFIELFKSNVQKMSELREYNLKNLYPDKEYQGSMAPMLYNGSSESFELAELAFLEQVAVGYCSNRQDYQPCVDVVFNQK